MSTEALREVTLRPGSAADLPAVAELFLATRRTAVPAMPAMVHDDAQVRAHILGLDLTEPDHELWVATLPGEGLAGFARLRADWLDDLYVAPDHQGQGIGSTLLQVVKAQRPEGFSLWVFASNARARALYGRHGLVTLESTDGRGNEEGAPDVRMAWPGPDALAFFRQLIDAVDDQLGDLLARRAALTAAVQRHKAAIGEPPDRDPRREAEIATALALRAPALGEHRLRRIVHAIISESLDAAGER